VFGETCPVQTLRETENIEEVTHSEAGAWPDSCPAADNVESHLGLYRPRPR
jgi:hypothetical protein